MLCYQEPGPGGLVPVCLGLAQTQPPDPSIYIIARRGGRPGRGLIVDNIFHATWPGQCTNDCFCALVAEAKFLKWYFYPQFLCRFEHNSHSHPQTNRRDVNMNRQQTPPITLHNLVPWLPHPRLSVHCCLFSYMLELPGEKEKRIFLQLLRFWQNFRHGGLEVEVMKSLLLPSNISLQLWK